ncbi:MAG: phosphomannomutase [Gammaproteobacteria bacterium]|jgi:phosphomannomutase|nr:phosphomannomutase [Gammaproteobacteria bacterium]
MTNELTCFKAYDIRGRVPDQLNEDIAYRIGRAYCTYLKPKTVVVGFDIRLTSLQLSNALIDGLTDGGADVINIGQCGTEEVYFATSYLETDGGIAVTASHNPKDYNGMKLVRENSKPISGDTGLTEIKRLAELSEFSRVESKGDHSTRDPRAAYIDHLLTYVNDAKINNDANKPLKIVCNAGNGGAGSIVDLLEAELPFEFIKIHHEADGNFPHGVPNPLLLENRQPTIDAIRDNQADLAIAWDGDFDRCFFFDAEGRFIEGYYIVGLLAKAFLVKNPGAKIVHDPRLTWNTIELTKQYGGESILCKTGHAFIKERMRLEDAVYGGEMSAHHYFKDFFYCDSGMVPWLLVIELMLVQGKTLAELVDERMIAFPASGEINNTVADPEKLINSIRLQYEAEAVSIDNTDGLSVECSDWRFNIRLANTEPVVRLNVESRGDVALMELKTAELLSLIKA